MDHSTALIKKTRRKFILYSSAGIVFVILLSFLGLGYHNQIISKQRVAQKVYGLVSDQFALISRIASISEKFDEENRNIEYRQEFYEKLKKLKTSYTQLEEYLDSPEASDAAEIHKILDVEDRKMFIDQFLDTGEKLLALNPSQLDKASSYIARISESSREGIGDLLLGINAELTQSQVDTTTKIYRTGVFLVILCILQVSLVWILVFRPLYSAIIEQHNRLVDTALSAKSASRSKTDFLANISHEIRTPMTAIIGYANLLKSSKISDEEHNDAIRIINQNANHLIELIDEILDISKIEAGKFDFKSEEIDLSSFLNQVYSLIHVKAAEKGLDLIFSNRGKIPETVLTDPKRLKQILYNILGNAIKFTDTGYVELVVSFDTNSNKLRITVKDTGRGIDEKRVKKLFKPFQQADTSVSREHGGTGLGLVLSRGLARKMGGDIKILESLPGIGTTFEITIFAGKQASDHLVNRFSTAIIEEDENIQISETALKNLRLMVVDDAKENARLFGMYLSQAGATVKVVNSGKDAIEYAKNNYLDLVLLDLQMPQMDGFAVLESLRSQSFKRPVLALTAHAMPEEKEKTKEAGFDGHITKPVDPESLVRYVRKAHSGFLNS